MSQPNEAMNQAMKSTKLRHMFLNDSAIGPFPGPPTTGYDSCTVTVSVLSATRVRQVPHAVGVAHERNEKSQHSPHVCSSGCAHGKPKAPKSTQPQVYRGKRPWVMEHG